MNRTPEKISSKESKDFVIGLAKQAGEIITRYAKSGDYTSHSKGGVDFVTQADLDVDSFLIKELQAKYPQSILLTEETAPKSGDYSSFQNKDNVWVIDPIDGTTIFSRGINDISCISIALIHQSVQELGVVYLPKKDQLFYAEQDVPGAFLNGQPINVSQVSRLGEAVTLNGQPWNMEKRKALHKLEGELYQHVRANLSLGAAAAEMSFVAEGLADAYFSTGIGPWDQAAASLIVEKAGGKVTKLDGSEWNIFQADILASNGKIHDALLTIFIP